MDERNEALKAAREHLIYALGAVQTAINYNLVALPTMRGDIIFIHMIDCQKEIVKAAENMTKAATAKT